MPKKEKHNDKNCDNDKIKAHLDNYGIEELKERETDLNKEQIIMHRPPG